MAFDLAAILRELEAAPPAAELPWDVGVAVVNDTLRLAGLVSPAARASGRPAKEVAARLREGACRGVRAPDPRAPTLRPAGC